MKKNKQIYIFFIYQKKKKKQNTFKLTGESAQVRPMDVLGITMNYESFSRPISLLPAAGCCAVLLPGPVARMF